MDIATIPDEALAPLTKAMEVLPPERRGEVLTKAAAAVRRHAALLAAGRTPNPADEKDVVGRTVFQALAKQAPGGVEKGEPASDAPSTRQTLQMLEKAVVAGARAQLEKGFLTGAARLGGLATGHAIYGTKAAAGAVRRGVSRALGVDSASRARAVAGAENYSRLKSAASSARGARQYGESTYNNLRNPTNGKAPFSERGARNMADHAERSYSAPGGVGRAEADSRAMMAGDRAGRQFDAAAGRKIRRAKFAAGAAAGLGVGAAAYGATRRRREG